MSTPTFTAAQVRRNPVLGLPSAKRLTRLSPEARSALSEFLTDLQAEGRRRAEESWRKNKAPMACYWKAVGVYAGHLRRGLEATL